MRLPWLLLLPTLRIEALSFGGTPKAYAAYWEKLLQQEYREAASEFRQRR